MKKLKYIEGNLLLSKVVQVVGHQANCQNTFGSGIARSIGLMYPEAYSADTESARNGSNKLGKFSRCEIPLINGIANKEGNQISRIYNLYGQNLGADRSKLNHRKTDYEALYCALEGMANELFETEADQHMFETEADQHMFDYCREPVVGFPFKMGSALGGGNWDIVSRLIECAFDGYKSDVCIYKFTNAFEKRKPTDL